MNPIQRLIRNFRYGKPVIVVSGLPRSGTSMAMKMLEAGGLSPVIDGIREADVDNPKGYYEDERVKDLHDNPDRSWLQDARGKVIKIISFMLPDLPGDNNYKVIFMRRHIDEVLASQQKMLDRRGETNETDDAEMAKFYKDDILRVKSVIRCRPHLEALEVEYKAVLDDPQAQAERMCEFLGMKLDIEAMTGVVDKNLYRNRAS